MRRLKESRFYYTLGLFLSLVLISQPLKANVTSATSSIRTPFTPNTDTTKPSNSGVLPFLHYAKQIDNNWHFGFSISVPFCSEANYKNDSIARYTISRAEMKASVTRFDNSTQLTLNEKHKNVYRVAASGSYQYNDPWRFRFGLMFDQSPVPDANKNILIPNQNRVLPTIGAQYRICKTLALDFGYSHIFFKKDKNLNVGIPTTVGIVPVPAQNLQGSIKNRIDAIGLQLTWDIEP